MNKQTKNTQKVNNIFDRLKDALGFSTDAELAKSLSVQPNAFGNWRSRGTIDYEKIFTICDEHNIDINWIINGKREKEGNYTRIVNDNQSKYPIQKFVAPKVVTVGQTGEDNIVLVPEKAAAGYLSGYGDPEFIHSLPTYNIPNLQNGTFRMFQVSGHSMYPTLHNGSFVVGEWVENWINDIKDDRVYIVVSEVDGVTVKRVLNRIEKYDSLYCKSDNRREYPNFTVQPKNIIEIWQVKMHLSFELPNPAQFYDRLNDLEAIVMHLENQIKKK